jgi:two-component system sensor histidine kinase PilS (NtrC family)
METSPNSKSLFNYYNAYKFILGLLLYLLVLSEHSYLNQFRSLAYFDTLTIVYLSLNLLSLILYRFYIKVKPKQIFALLIIDIIFLHAIFFYGTGITNGLGNLIIISVAAGNIIIRGRIGLSFAAIAAILSLFVEIERFLNSQSQENNIAQSGLVGIMYFASAFILQSLSRRITENESLLKQQKQDLLELEKLNHQIIQSMRTGIIVCTQDQKIKLINEACKDLLNLEHNQQLPTALEERFNHWRQQPLKRSSPFRVNANLPMVQANFSRLHTNGSSNVIIFIENTRKMAQQAQQLKLASLGRLTASIAHEVRNPLGAISHATQLLAESKNLDFADMKMTDIIQRHSQRVNQIIENTLQLSRRSEASIENILVTPWLEKIIYDFEVQTRHKSQAQRFFVLSNNKDLLARFDPNQMEQVIINLIENAIHHGKKQFNDLSIFIYVGETKDQNQVFIDVIDQGAGITSENIEHLFEPFFTTESQGTGLGLYLSREICEANQAQLEFLDPCTHYPQWQTPPSTEDSEIQKLNNTRKFGACFRVLLAHNKRIL